MSDTEPTGGMASTLALSGQQLKELIARLQSNTKPKIKQLETFVDDRSHLHEFLSQLKLHFKADKAKFKDDDTKITFAASYLRGSASKWFEPYLEDNNAYIKAFLNYEAFVKAISASFGNTDEKGMAQ